MCNDNNKFYDILENEREIISPSEWRAFIYYLFLRYTLFIHEIFSLRHVLSEEIIILIFSLSLLDSMRRALVGYMYM